MLFLRLTPLTVLVEFYFCGDGLLVLARPVIDALAGAAGKFYQFVL
jgi:hypothetical protein